MVCVPSPSLPSLQFLPNEKGNWCYCLHLWEEGQPSTRCCLKPHPFGRVFPHALSRQAGSNAVCWCTPCSSTPVLWTLWVQPSLVGAHKFLVERWWGQELQLPGDPKPVSQARADGDLSWGLWVQVGRHDTLRLFHAQYWKAHHAAAFDHYPLWMKARSNDVEMKASVSQKQSPKPSKSL